MSVIKSAYYCPFCNSCFYDVAAVIVQHCKKSHGKTVKADDCQTPRSGKQTEWFQARQKLAERFKRK